MIDLYPGAFLRFLGKTDPLRARLGSMACFFGAGTRKELYVITNAHVLSEDGKPAGQLLPTDNLWGLVDNNLVAMGEIVEKDPATDIGVVRVKADIAKRLEKRNFHLEGVDSKPAITGYTSEALAVGTALYILGGKTKKVLKGTVKRSGSANRVWFEGDKTQPGDSGSPIYVLVGEEAHIVGVFGNADPADTTNSFGEHASTFVPAIQTILQAQSVFLAHWGNRTAWS
jgi:S1-C subfamily serine protease